jgi:hypothetical protein
MNKVVVVGSLLLSLVVSGCAQSAPGKDDVRKVVQAELDRQAGTTPGARMELKDMKGFKANCVQGATPETSELYSCTLGGTMVVRGYVNDTPTTSDDKEAPLKGVMSFKKNAAGDWAVVNWEGA